MLYVSQIQGKQVWDAWSQPVGRCIDLLVGSPEKPFPPVVALVVRTPHGEQDFIPADEISALYPAITLNVPLEKHTSYQPTGEELWLTRDGAAGGLPGALSLGRTVPGRAGVRPGRAPGTRSRGPGSPRGRRARSWDRRGRRAPRARAGRSRSSSGTCAP